MKTREIHHKNELYKKSREKFELKNIIVEIRNLIYLLADLRGQKRNIEKNIHVEVCNATSMESGGEGHMGFGEERLYV